MGYGGVGGGADHGMGGGSGGLGGRDSKALDDALSRGDWAGAMDAAFGAGGWGRDAGGSYGAPSGMAVGALRDGIYGIDRFGSYSKLGTRSPLGGMMTTAKGWEGTYNNVGIGDSRHSAHGDYRSDLQSRIKAAAETRRQNEAAMKSAIDFSKLGWSDRVKANDALKTGDLAALDDLGFSTADMRSSHHAGGLLGSMFGVTGDDVQTLSETGDILGDVDPNNPMGFSALGFGLKTASPGVAQQLGMITKSPTVGRLTNKAISKVGSLVGPRTTTAQNIAGGLLGMAGLPGAQATQAMGLMSRAADLNYAGYTGSREAPTPASRNDSLWWPTFA